MGNRKYSERKWRKVKELSEKIPEILKRMFWKEKQARVGQRMKECELKGTKLCNRSP